MGCGFCSRFLHLQLVFSLKLPRPGISYIFLIMNSMPPPNCGGVSQKRMVGLKILQWQFLDDIPEALLSLSLQERTENVGRNPGLTRSWPSEPGDSEGPMTRCHRSGAGRDRSLFEANHSASHYKKNLNRQRNQWCSAWKPSKRFEE